MHSHWIHVANMRMCRRLWLFKLPVHNTRCVLCNNGWLLWRNVKVKRHRAGCSLQRAHVQQGLRRRGCGERGAGGTARAHKATLRCIVVPARVTLHRFTFRLARNRLCAFYRISVAQVQCGGRGGARRRAVRFLAPRPPLVCIPRGGVSPPPAPSCHLREPSAIFPLHLSPNIISYK